MISWETITLFQVIINLGYKIKCLPFKLVTNKKDKSFRLVPVTNLVDLLLTKAVVCIFLLLQVAELTAGIYFEVYCNPSSKERCQFYFTAAFMLMAMGMQATTVVFSGLMLEIINAYFFFLNKLRKSYFKVKLQLNI